MNKRKIRRIVRSIAPELRVTFKKGDGSWYDEDEEKINYDFTDVDPDTDGGFSYHLEHSHKCGEALTIPFSVWTLLHEIGHHFTLEFTHRSELTECIKLMCSTYSREQAQVDPELAKTYFDLPEEWDATEWAINFVRSSPLLTSLLEHYLAPNIIPRLE